MGMLLRMAKQGLGLTLMAKAKERLPVPYAAIRNAMRKLWMWGPARREALRAARIYPGVYLCSGCVKAFKAHEVDVDHTVPVGPTPGSRLGLGRSWDEFIKALFCPVEGLRCLCKGCHMERRKAG